MQPDLLLTFLVGALMLIIGMGLFSLGAEQSMTPIGNQIGTALTRTKNLPLILAVSFLLGFAITIAKPDLQVLAQTVPHISNTVLLITVGTGAIPGRVIKLSLSVAIALAMGLSMLRVITGISLFWFLIPGYATALLLTFFVPDIYTAIAFDSGGVASGPMTATFMLQFFMGASIALGGNVLQEAFGVVALVAMMPLVSIQLVGLFYEQKTKAYEGNYCQLR